MSHESICSVCSRLTGFGDEDRFEPPVNLARCPAPGGLECRAVAQAVAPLRREMDDWIARARDAERLADERLAHANQLQADIEAEMQGRLALRKRLGARENETMGAFLERLATMAGAVPVEVHECGWQWRPVTTDTAFAPPFGTIRQCQGCGCLVAGGPTACVRCAEAGT